MALALRLRAASSAAWRAMATWPKTRLGRALLAFSALALIGLAAIDLATRLRYETRGPLTADTAIYAAVGRGVLNGVPLYSGLFETKPPLIFLLFALSFKTVGSGALATWVQVAAVAAIAIAPPLIVLREGRGLTQLATRVAIALLGGAALALYTALRSGEIQVESFGAAALLPWIWSTSRRSRPPTVVSVVAGTVSVAVAAMTKEPFVFAAVAVALIFARSRRDLVEFGAMMGLAALLDLLALSVTGALGGYFRVYLPEMRGQGDFSAGPVHTVTLLRRALEWGHLWKDLWSYAPGLDVALVGASVAAIAVERSAGRSALSILIRWVTALSLCTFAIGLSGRFYNHQYVPAVPLAAAILVTWLLSDESGLRGAVAAVASVTAVLGLVAVTLWHERPDLGRQLAKLREREASARAAATQIDRALDCTGEKRYAYIGANGIEPWGWTTHSPIGPFFFQYGAWFRSSQPKHREQLLAELEQARLLVFRRLAAGDFNDTLRSAIDARFRRGLPRACADIKLAGPWSFRFADSAR